MGEKKELNLERLRELVSKLDFILTKLRMGEGFRFIRCWRAEDALEIEAVNVIKGKIQLSAKPFILREVAGDFAKLSEFLRELADVLEELEGYRELAKELIGVVELLDRVVEGDAGSEG